MPRSMFAGIVVLVAAFAVAAEPPKPALKVRAKSIADFGPLVAYAGSILGEDASGKAYADKIAELAAGKDGFEGIDVNNPIGAYVAFGDNVEESPVMVMVPVVSEKAFLEFLSGKLGLEPKKNDDGSYGLDVPNIPGLVFLRFVEGYAYIALRSKESVEAKNLPKAGDFFPKKLEHFVEATIEFDRIPLDVKKAIYGQFELQLKTYLDGLQPSKFQKLLNDYWSDLVVEVAKTVLLDGEQLTVHFDAAPKTDDIAFDLRLTAKPKTTLADALKGFGDRESLPATVIAAVEEPVARVALNFALPPEAKKSIGTLADAAKTLFQDGAGDAERIAIEAAAQAVVPTLKSGDLQLGASVVPKKGEKFAVKFAAKVEKGDNIRSLLQFAAIGIPKDQAKMTMTAAKLGEAKLHKLQALDLAQSFPFDAVTSWFLTSDALFLAEMSEKKDGLEAMAKAKPASMPMLDASVSAVALLAVLNADLGVEKLQQSAIEQFGKVRLYGTDAISIRAAGGTDFRLALKAKGKGAALYFAQQKLRD